MAEHIPACATRTEQPDRDPHQKIPQPGSVVLLTDVLNERKPEWKLGKVMGVIRGRTMLFVDYPRKKRRFTCVLGKTQKTQLTLSKKNSFCVEKPQKKRVKMYLKLNKK
jgi:hypothetical protein